MTAFDALFVPPTLRAASRAGRGSRRCSKRSGRSRAAGSRAGIVPAEAAAAIAAACDPDAFDLDADRGARAGGRHPGRAARPCASRLGRQPSTERYIHFGATSQDILDTAAMLVTRASARPRHSRSSDGRPTRRAALAKAHRSTPIAGRTLLQQAVPTTFGLKAAGWLVALLDARNRLARLARRTASPLSSAAPRGRSRPSVSTAFRCSSSSRPSSSSPCRRCRGTRTASRIAELGSALGSAAGASARSGSTWCCSPRPRSARCPNRSRSRRLVDDAAETEPRRRDARACVLRRLAAGHVTVLVGSLEQEHERAAGAWQAEWEALSGALAFTGAAAASIAGSLEGLEVDPARMRANLELTRRPRHSRAGVVPARRADRARRRRTISSPPRRSAPATADRSGTALLADPGSDLADGRARRCARSGDVSRLGRSARRPRARACTRGGEAAA